MNYQVILFRNKINLLDSSCSLTDGHLSAIIEASMIFLVRSSIEDERRTFQVNE